MVVLAWACAASAVLWTLASPVAASAAGGRSDQSGATLWAGVSAAVGGGEPSAALVRDAEAVLTELLTRDELDDAEQRKLVDASAARQAGIFLQRLGDRAAAHRATLAWLFDQPRLGRLLCLALRPEDDVDRALLVLDALRRIEGHRLDRYAELTTALCVVLDQPHAVEAGGALEVDEAAVGAGRAKEAEGVSFEAEESGGGAVAFDAAAVGERARALFRYYVDEQTQYDLAAMPWQLSMYLADGWASVDELQWARRTYGGRSPRVIGKVYFDVPYDKVGLYFGRWQGIQGKPYTLENIRDAGGVCKDQAYFAAHVILSMGIPAVQCQGRSGRGVGYHCWVGYLRPDGDEVVWDFNTARYEAHRFWSARVIDPQTREALTDGDVSLTALLHGVDARARQTAEALVRSIDLASSADRARWLKAAINLAPGHRGAWLALADHYGEAGATPEQLKQMLDVLRRLIVGRYDEFGYELYVRMIAGQPHARRLASLTGVMSLFDHRPDLTARLRMAQADVLREMGRAQRAVTVYTQAAVRNLEQPAIVLDAMDRIDATLRGEAQLDRLAQVYEQVWGRMRPPDKSGYAWTTPWFLMGERYAALLEEMNEQTRAGAVRSMLSSRDTRPGEMVGGDS